jgi:hypothetical protein
MGYVSHISYILWVNKNSGGFAMDRLQDIVWSDEPMKSLVLGAKHKALIQALVGQHIRRAASYDDFVAGKGKVILINFFFVSL